MDDPLLHRELFTIREAARLLKADARKLQRWLDGERSISTFIQPVIRRVPTGDPVVTWGEFVELACLLEYRQHSPLQEIRHVIDKLRDRYDLLYPLASYRPLITGRELVAEVQDEVELPEDLRLVERLRDGQLGFADPIAIFTVKVTWADGGDQHALRLHPNGKQSPVVIDPEFSFGWATVSGIRTDALAELVSAREDPDDVLDWYGLQRSELEAALRYEGVS